MCVVLGEFIVYKFTRVVCLVLRLQVVSTRVGGVPEVLPSDLIRLAEPNVSCKIKRSMYITRKYELITSQ